MLTAVQKNIIHTKVKEQPKSFFQQARLIQKKRQQDILKDTCGQKIKGSSAKVNTKSKVQLRSQSGPLLQKKCTACEEDEQLQMKPLRDRITPLIQKRTESSNEGRVASDAISNQISQSKGGGTKMDSSTQDYMESRFGTDFSGVNIHTDSMAVRLSKGLNAKAFATGNDIYFNEGMYNPSTSSGKHLLAHELTHTIQQGGYKSNNTIQRALSEGDIENNVQIYSTNCGWIDWPHASGENARPIIEQVRSARRGQRFTARWPGHHHHAEIRVEFLSDLALESGEVKKSVALGIFMELSNTFENNQADVDSIPLLGYRSAFSIEDLPSNLIGFYRVLNGLGNTKTGICRLCNCWSKASSKDRLEIDEDSGLLERWNRDFRPIELYRGGVWPDQFATVMPASQGEHWRVVSTYTEGLFSGPSARETISRIGEVSRTMPNPSGGISSRRTRTGVAWVDVEGEELLIIAYEALPIRRLNFTMWVPNHFRSLAIARGRAAHREIPTISSRFVSGLPSQVPRDTARR